MIDVEMKKFVMQQEYVKDGFHIEFDSEADEKTFKEIFYEKMNYDVAEMYKPCTTHCLSLFFNQNVYWYYYKKDKVFQIKFDTNQTIDFDTEEWKHLIHISQIYYTTSGKLSGNKKMLENFMNFCREKKISIKVKREKQLF